MAAGTTLIRWKAQVSELQRGEKAPVSHLRFHRMSVVRAAGAVTWRIASWCISILRCRGSSSGGGGGAAHLRAQAAAAVHRLRADVQSLVDENVRPDGPSRAPEVGDGVAEQRPFRSERLGALDPNLPQLRVCPLVGVPSCFVRHQNCHPVQLLKRGLQRVKLRSDVLYAVSHFQRARFRQVQILRPLHERRRLRLLSEDIEHAGSFEHAGRLLVAVVLLRLAPPVDVALRVAVLRLLVAVEMAN